MSNKRAQTQGILVLLVLLSVLAATIWFLVPEKSQPLETRTDPKANNINPDSDNITPTPPGAADSSRIKKDSFGFKEDLLNQKLDISGFFKKAGELGTKQKQSDKRFELAVELLTRDIRLLPEIVQNLKDINEVARVIAYIAPVLTRQDSKRALEIINGALTGVALNVGLQSIAHEQVALGFVSDAIKTQLSMPFSSERSKTIMTIGSNIDSTDLVGVKSWIGSLSGGERNTAIGRIIDQTIAKDSPSLLSALLSQTDDSSLRSKILSNLGYVYTKTKNSQALQELMDSLPAREQKQLQVTKIVSDTALTPEQKMFEALKVPDDFVQGTVAGAMIEAKTKESLDAAVRWFDERPPEQQGLLVGHLTSTWARIDSEGASVWVQKLPVGTIKNRAAGALAMTLIDDDPQSASLVSGWITDEKQRNWLLDRINRKR